MQPVRIRDSFPAPLGSLLLRLALPRGGRALSRELPGAAVGRFASSRRISSALGAGRMPIECRRSNFHRICLNLKIWNRRAGSSTCPSIRDGVCEYIESTGNLGPERDLKQRGPLIQKPARWLESTPFSRYPTSATPPTRINPNYQHSRCCLIN